MLNRKQLIAKYERVEKALDTAMGHLTPISGSYWEMTQHPSIVTDPIEKAKMETYYQACEAVGQSIAMIQAQIVGLKNKTCY